MKRAIKSFEADEDVNRMLARAAKEGIKVGFICNAALREYLRAKGYARKKDITMKLAACIFLIAAACRAELPPEFFTALHHVEASGRPGAIVGDGGRALGPYQIHRGYWQDSRVAGRYEQVADEAYARRVVTAYLTRYAQQAVRSGDLETLVRIHNGGPRGDSKAETAAYWRKVQAHLKGASHVTR